MTDSLIGRDKPVDPIRNTLPSSRIDKLRPNGLARQMRVRVEPVEREAFDRAAQLTGLTLSAWVRMTLREAAERRLATAGDKPGWA